MTPTPTTFFARDSTRPLRVDLVTVAALVILDVTARLLPHVPDFTPLAATGLFAASALRVRALALLVPISGMLLSDVILGFHDFRVMAVTYGALALPAALACLSGRLRRPRGVLLMLVSSPLTFFVVTNLAVWAFSPIYAANASGLIKCYAAALPFLRYMFLGDLFWGIVLFGSYWLVQGIHAAKYASAHARP